MSRLALGGTICCRFALAAIAEFLRRARLLPSAPLQQSLTVFNSTTLGATLVLVLPMVKVVTERKMLALLPGLVLDGLGVARLFFGGGETFHERHGLEDETRDVVLWLPRNFIDSDDARC